MYCESAQKDCVYLEYVDNLGKSSFLIQAIVQAAEKQSSLSQATQAIEEEARSVMEAIHEGGVCDTDQCAVIGVAVVNSIICKALLKD